jgi:Polyphosphate kinase N-terminal domain
MGGLCVGVSQSVMQRAALTDPRYYLNRHGQWLEFNRRVLEEARDVGNPLLERMKFLAITANNLDEFVEVRGTDRLGCEQVMKTAGRENPNRRAAVPCNRAPGAAAQNRSCSFKWATFIETYLEFPSVCHNRIPGSSGRHARQV